MIIIIFIFRALVSMEEDEVEMTKKELQMWIRRKVQKNQRIVALVEKRNLLRSLLKRREDQANQLQQLSRWESAPPTSFRVLQDSLQSFLAAPM